MKAILSTAMVVVIATTASSQSFSGGGPGAPPVVILEEVPDQTYAAILATLREQGYEIVSISNTWLNRVRITARNTSHVREIVLSRATGQILRDALIE